MYSGSSLPFSHSGSNGVMVHTSFVTSMSSASQMAAPSANDVSQSSHMATMNGR